MSPNAPIPPPVGRLPREEYVNTLPIEKLKEFYVKAGQKKKTARAPRKTTRRAASGYSRRGGAGGASGKNFVTITGNGEYYPVPAGYHDPRARIDLEKQYAFDPTYGQRLGATLGEGVQSFAKALGFGEYNIQSNSLCSEKWVDMGTSPPKVKNTSKGEATVFSHREYLGELITGAGTPSAFTLQEYAINVGNPSLFPFAARIAENFQEWEVRGMLVELKSECSETSTTLSLGSMFCAVDYNSLDPAPVDKTELENMEYACSNKPSSSILMPIECKRSNDVLTHLYIAVDEDYQGGDKRLYDLGRLFIGSFGCPAAAAPIAEIWITYEIAFYKPHLHIEPPEQFAAHYFAPDVVDAQPFLAVAEVFNNSEITMGPDVIFFPERTNETKYLITAYWESTNATVTGFTTPLLVNCTFNGIFGGIPSTYITNGGANTNKMFITTSVIVPAATSGASIEFAGLTLPGTAVTDEPFVTLIVNHLSTGFVLTDDVKLFEEQEREEKLYQLFRDRFLQEMPASQAAGVPQHKQTRLSGKFA